MRVHFRMSPIAVAIPGVILAVVFVSAVVSGQTRGRGADQGVATRQAASPDANTKAVALVEFQKRLQAYIDLRAQLSGKLKPLSPTADSAELAARQDTLAAAIRQARKTAKPGDVIPTLVAEQIRHAVAEDLRHRAPDAKRAVVEEVPAVKVAVNKAIPDTAALPTVPPLLLNNLPKLPDNLQYRFMGRHMVLLDGDTRIIVDYILNVLPPH